LTVLKWLISRMVPTTTTGMAWLGMRTGLVRFGNGSRPYGNNDQTKGKIPPLPPHTTGNSFLEKSKFWILTSRYHRWHHFVTNTIKFTIFGSCRCHLRRSNRPIRFVKRGVPVYVWDPWMLKRWKAFPTTATTTQEKRTTGTVSTSLGPI